MGQAGQGMLVVRIQAQHIFQADLFFRSRVHYGAEPKPGQNIVLIEFGNAKQQLSGPLLLLQLGYGKIRNSLG